MPDPHPDHAARLDRVDRIARRMDRAFRVPVVGMRVGYDSILGLIPGIGDALALAPAGYILLEAHRLGASLGTLARMGANVGIDFVIGAIPLIGDLFDIGWKANTRNAALLRRDLSRRSPAIPRRPRTEAAHQGG
ncbi:DUF4112 domain-containing protein [Pseudaestuariivita atlantica]|uniref:DUF4112 domain-containing protein n=1 Tax=Pseudaestuariivita atlantica TaxID=1317121 RepID=A0A0L1JMB3_9RHOB|nr:DUF4112 domain-containing protein [Pseudaestuariivita atlantica]KNG92895.1 hypothetical protein ATO11_15675 [Pseudaestuariivita atlantica]